MSWFQKLIGRDKQQVQTPDAQPSIKGAAASAEGMAAKSRSIRSGGFGDDAVVPMRVFLDFKEESSQRHASMSRQYQRIVSENDELKRTVLDFGVKLEQVMRDQARMRKDTDAKLHDVRRDVAVLQSKSDPTVRSQLISAESALTALKPKPKTESRPEPAKSLVQP